MKDIFKYIWQANKCKRCDYKTFSAIKMWWHITKVENIKPTKRDIKHLIKWSIPGRLIMTLLEIILIIFNFVIFIVTYPIWAIHEHMFY